MTAQAKKWTVFAASVTAAVLALVFLITGIVTLVQDNSVNLNSTHSFDYPNDKVTVYIKPNKSVKNLSLGITFLDEFGFYKGSVIVALGDVAAGEKEYKSITISHRVNTDIKNIKSVRVQLAGGNYAQNYSGVWLVVFSVLFTALGIIGFLVFAKRKFEKSEKISLKPLLDKIKTNASKIKEWTTRNTAEESEDKAEPKQPPSAPQTKAARIGEEGEDRIAGIFTKQERPWRILRNLYIPAQGEKTAEIDMLFINKYGIFVVESKNYSGYIYGTVFQRTWTVTYKNGRKQKLYNPIWQNRAHVRYLKELLGDLSGNIFFSLTIFGSSSEIKTDLGELKPNESIMKAEDLTAYLYEFEKLHKHVLSEEEINLIADELEKKYCRQPEEIKEAHVKNLNLTREIKVAKDTCIICGKASSGKLCYKCKKKLTDNGIELSGINKCTLCGAPSGDEKLCHKCKNKLEKEGLLRKIADDPKEIEQEEIKEEKHHPFRNCCLFFTLVFLVLFIFFTAVACGIISGLF